MRWLLCLSLCVLCLGCMSKYNVKSDPITGEKRHTGIIGTTSNGVSGITLEGTRSGVYGHIRIYCTQELYFDSLKVRTDAYTIPLRCSQVGMRSRGIGVFYVSSCQLERKHIKALGAATFFDFQAGHYFGRSAKEWVKNLRRIFGNS